MKKVFFLLIMIACTYLIYFCSHRGSINYVAISDNVMANKTGYSAYLKNSMQGKRIFNEFNPYFINYNAQFLCQDIKENKTIRINNQDYYFKKSLRESDIVVISVGMEELSNNYNKYNIDENYQYFNKMFLDIEKLVLEIRKYAQDKIVFLGYYNPTNYYDSKVDEFFFDIDIRLNRLMINNDIIYVNLYEHVKGNNYKEKNSVYLNNIAYQKIAKILAFYLES